MTLFLTSNIGGVKKENGQKYATNFFEQNKFLENLKKHIKNNKKFVLIASNPTNYEQNDLFLDLDKKALNLSGIDFDEYLVLDNRNKIDACNILKNSDLIFLCGGDTFVQNEFFNEIQLKEHIKKVNSVIVGISAGSINAALNVFNSPECKEDLVNSSNLQGLGLTSINIEPHFRLNNTNTLNEKIQREAIIKESYNRDIYAIPDGSYILEDSNYIYLYGECYKIKNGNINLICKDDEMIKISK